MVEMSGSRLSPLDSATIKPPQTANRDALAERCRVAHITQIRQSTMVRVSFEKSLRVESSGIRMLHGDEYTLRVKYTAAEGISGLRLRHWNGGFDESLEEFPMAADAVEMTVALRFGALDENGEELRDPEARVPMRTQIVDSDGIVYAQVDWFIVINDFFEIE